MYSAIPMQRKVRPPSSKSVNPSGATDNESRHAGAARRHKVIDFAVRETSLNRLGADGARLCHGVAIELHRVRAPQAVDKLERLGNFMRSQRSEERRSGNGGVSTCISRG